MDLYNRSALPAECVFQCSRKRGGTDGARRRSAIAGICIEIFGPGLLIRNPRFEAYRIVDVLQLLASDACLGAGITLPVGAQDRKPGALAQENNDGEYPGTLIMLAPRRRGTLSRRARLRSLAKRERRQFTSLQASPLTVRGGEPYRVLR